jgi:hypothetical protein
MVLLFQFNFFKKVDEINMLRVELIKLGKEKMS